MVFSLALLAIAMARKAIPDSQVIASAILFDVTLSPSTKKKLVPKPQELQAGETSTSLMTRCFFPCSEKSKKE